MQAEAAQRQRREAVGVEGEDEAAEDRGEHEQEHQPHIAAQQEVDQAMLVHARLR
ncbi:hypothetical protein D3C73_1654430 [compost metagenome]